MKNILKVLMGVATVLEITSCVSTIKKNFNEQKNGIKLDDDTCNKILLNVDKQTLEKDNLKNKEEIYSKV